MFPFCFSFKMYRKFILLVLKSSYAWKHHNFIAHDEEWASLLSSAWKCGSHRLISFFYFQSFVQWKGCYFLLFFNGNMTQTCNVSMSRLLQWAASNCTTTEGVLLGIWIPRYQLCIWSYTLLTPFEDLGSGDRL